MGGCPLPSSAAVVANDMRHPNHLMDYTKKSVGVSLAPTEYREATAQRKHVLLLGDKLTDLDSAEGLAQDCIVLSICFASDGLSEGTDASSEVIDTLLARYDVVLTGDASMRFVNNFLRSVELRDVGTLKLEA